MTGQDARGCGCVCVCVIGNAAIDLVFRVDRLPTAGETSLATGTLRDFGGKGANQAVMAQRAGAHVQLFAAVGNDTDGELFLAHLAEEGMDTQFISRLSCLTDMSVITVDAQGENTIVTRNDAGSRYAPSVSEVLDATCSGDWIAMQGNLGEAVTASLLSNAHAGKRRTLLNPGPVYFDCRPMLPDVDVLVVNRVEAEALTGFDTPAEAAQALKAAGARDVIVTLGGEGVLWCNAGQCTRLAAVPANAVDTAGAGDAFCGVLLAALAQHKTMPHALQQAQAAAAFVVARRGTQAAFPGREALAAIVHSST